MPTGYTSDLNHGEVSFKDFAMGCARAFGALITMRDEDHDAKIPDKFEPGDYHATALKNAEADLKKYESFTIEEANTAAEESYLSAYKSVQDRCEKNAALKNRYEAMIKKVLAWYPPTSDHAELKCFMLEQLESSIKHDCYEIEPAVKITGAEWLANVIKSAKWSIDYHKEEQKKEIERCESRTAWVRALRESLK